MPTLSCALSLCVSLLAAPAPPAALPFDVGAHLVQGFAGTHAHDPGVRDLRQRAEAGELGGIIFFSYNVESPDQLRALVRHVRGWQVPEHARPLMLMVDQEGGHVQRLARSRGFHGWPGPQAVGEMAPQRARATLAAMAEEMAAYGLNVNAAPVLDLANPHGGLIGGRGRSFGSSPGLVTERAGWQIDAQRAHGVASVVKHFPGHGLSRGDTHAGAVDATRSWQRRELVPFAQLIRAGKVDALMSSHLVHHDLEPSGAPLTFSRTVMHGMLRGELGYQGVLVTDDLGMGAVAQHYAPEEAVVGALGSGHDLLLFGLNEAARGHGREVHKPFPELYARAGAAVRAALASGTLTPELLAQSQARLAKFRRRLAAHAPVVAKAGRSEAPQQAAAP